MGLPTQKENKLLLLAQLLNDHSKKAFQRWQGDAPGYLEADWRQEDSRFLLNLRFN